MAKEYADLITTNPPRPYYKFKCYLMEHTRDKSPIVHRGACLSGFGRKTEQYPSKKVVMYEWNDSAVMSRWDIKTLRKVYGKITLKLVRETVHRFYHLCRDHGMLPADLRIMKTRSRFFLKDFRKLSPSLFYAYMSHLRDAEEEPYFIHNVLTMVENYGLNPWTSYVVASHLSIVNSGHHILPISSGGYSSGLNKAVRLESMFNVRDYFTDPTSKDGRTIGNNCGTWSMHQMSDGGYYSPKACPFNAEFVLENVDLFNKALSKPKAEGEEMLMKSHGGMKIKGALSTYLKNNGYVFTQDYYEPWWITLVYRDKKVDKTAVLKSLKKAIDAYKWRQRPYKDGFDLMIRVGDNFLTASEKRKRDAFVKGGKRKSRYDNTEGVVNV